MEDVNIKFYGSGDTFTHTLELYCNHEDRIYVMIEEENQFAHITLNRPTAIQLSKRLRAEISKIESHER